MNNLKVLSLIDNEIGDIAPLSNLQRLETLVLDGNPLSQEQVEYLKTMLPNCEIFSNHLKEKEPVGKASAAQEASAKPPSVRAELAGIKAARALDSAKSAAPKNKDAQTR
jgi:hypothetical protein